jgi:hypothetical protein
LVAETRGAQLPDAHLGRTRTMTIATGRRTALKLAAITVILGLP